MLTSEDFVHLPYTVDLTQAGIAYACRSLPKLHRYRSQSRFTNLRRVVASVAVELAFRRHLNQQGIPYETRSLTPFTDPDRFDITIGGRRLDLETALFSHRAAIRRLRRSPESLLRARATVAVDEIDSDHLGMHDIYVFIYLSALTTPTRREIEKAISANQPIYLLHSMPEKWARPDSWHSLAPIVLKANTGQNVLVEVGGQDVNGEFQVENINLAPRVRSTIEGDFYSLTHMHCPNLPDGAIGVYSPLQGETHLVEPGAWGNVWVYGLDIILAGYLTRREFREKAQRLPAGRQVYPTQRSITETLAVDVEDLHPIEELFEQARRWAARRI